MSMVPNAAPPRYVCSGVGRMPRTSAGGTSSRIARSRSSRASSTRLPNAAEGAELARAGNRGGPAVDQEMLEAVVTDAYPERPVAIGGFQIDLPQIRRFEDVAVAVDHERPGRHGVAPP